MENFGFDVDALINAKVEAGLHDEAELESEEDENEEAEEEEAADQPDQSPTWSRAERRVDSNSYKRLNATYSSPTRPTQVASLPRTISRSSPPLTLGFSTSSPTLSVQDLRKRNATRSITKSPASGQALSTGKSKIYIDSSQKTLRGGDFWENGDSSSRQGAGIPDRETASTQQQELDHQEWNRQQLERQDPGQQEDVPSSLWTKFCNAIASINRALLSFLGIPKLWNTVGSFISCHPIISSILLISIAIVSCIQYQIRTLYGPQSISSNSTSSTITPGIDSIVNSLLPLYLPSNHKDVEHLAREFHLMRKNTESCYAPWNVPDKIPLKVPQPEKTNEQYCLDNWIVYVSRRHKSSRTLNLQIQDQRSLCIFLNCLGEIFNSFSRDLEVGRNEVKPIVPGFFNNLNRGARDALGWATKRKVRLAVIKEQRITGWEKVVYQNKDMTLIECLKGVVDDALSWDIRFRRLREDTKMRWRELTRDISQNGPCEKNTT